MIAQHEPPQLDRTTNRALRFVCAWSLADVDHLPDADVRAVLDRAAEWAPYRRDDATRRGDCPTDGEASSHVSLP